MSAKYQRSTGVDEAAERQDATLDGTPRDPNIQLADKDGMGTAQQQVDSKAELGGENVKSPPEQISPADATVSIPKPSTFDLDRFKSKRAAAMAGVETLQTSLPHHSIAQAKDFVRLHPDEGTYWSPELCFVTVPIPGARDQLHLIEEDLGMQFLPSARIKRLRLALASKPHPGQFFLCEVPTQNKDNIWVSSNLLGCEQAKKRWTQLTSRRDEGVDGYKIDCADEKAFSEPNWPKQQLSELIEVTFAGRVIDREDHPAFAASAACRSPYDEREFSPSRCVRFRVRGSVRRPPQSALHGGARAGREPPARAYHPFMAGGIWRGSAFRHRPRYALCCL
jgi:hypothetical protein